MAFYAIGAYGLALGYQYLGLGFWAMLPLGALMAALAGALLGFPVLRMHGDYGDRHAGVWGDHPAGAEQLDVAHRWAERRLGAGADGVRHEFGRRAKDGGVPIHEFLGIDYNPNLKFIFIYAVLFLVVLLVLYIKHRLTRMPIGRARGAARG